MRPTVDVNLSSGHCESVRTRLVLISCVSDHARCMAQVQVDPCLVTFVLFALRVIHKSSMSAWPLTGTSTAHAIDPFWLSSFDRNACGKHEKIKK